MATLSGKRVAIVATDGFEHSELLEPKRALEEAGAETTLVSLKGGAIKGWKNGNWSSEISVDSTVAEANSADFDALLLPGGVINPDKLRGSERAIEFIREFVASGKPIAAICHGPWTLINAGGVSGREMTSYHTIKIDLENAGAIWTDAPVVTDQGLVTSRSPEDIPQFVRKMIEEFAEGIHEERVQESGVGAVF